MDDDPIDVPTDGSLVWEVPSKPVSVRLSEEVVSRLRMAVREGFKSLPRRGLETGGLLIGTKRQAGDHVVVDVCDFEPVESEHAAGPSYLLSDADRRLLEASIAARKTVAGKTSIVGFYRSHTRRDFAITTEDASLFSTYFRKASDVFLLIKSNDGGPLMGGFIIWEQGKILCYSPYVQFPFERNIVLPAARETAVAFETSQAAYRPARIVQPRAAELIARKVRWPTWLAVAGAVAVVVLLLLSFGIQRRIPGSRPAEPSLPLALNVTSVGNGLRLSWDRQASRHAAHGILWIKDGQEEQRFELDSKQLNESSIAYWPRNADVTFRLELFPPGGGRAESIRAIGGPLIESAVVPPVKAHVAAAIKVSPAPVLAPKTPLLKKIGTTSRRVPRAFPFPLPQSNPAHLAPAGLPDPPTVQAMAGLPLEHSNELLKMPVNGLGPGDGAPAPFKVTVEPVSDSRLRQMTRNIPLIGKRNSRSDYVPPVPLRNPALPDSPHRNVPRDVSIDVKVYVNSAGKVDYSEVLSNVTETDLDLATLAVFSARRWEFVPARTADGAVPGEVILRYQFGPAARAAGNQAIGAH